MNLPKMSLAALCVLGLAGAALAEPLRPGARYVALGSSYAAGPGVGRLVGGEPARCARSTLSYARVLAARLKLDLVDASCSGATTAHVLGPWNELAPQINAVTPETRLVTITIGGNDVRFVGNLGAGACTVARAAGRPGPRCAAPRPATPEEWTALADAMVRIGREVRARAPHAQVIFVDYPTIVPPQGTCVALGVAENNAADARATARRLSQVTAMAARRSGARLLAASALTRGHDACAPEPWSLGATMRPGGVPMHPAIPAHAAIADALARMIGARR